MYAPTKADWYLTQVPVIWYVIIATIHFVLPAKEKVILLATK